MIKYVKMALISPSKIEKYQDEIARGLSEETMVLYFSKYYSVIDFIKDNPNLLCQIIVPNFYFDTPRKANDLAVEVKAVNPRNKVFSYSREVPIERGMLDIVMTDLMSEEDEIKNLISLLK